MTVKSRENAHLLEGREIVGNQRGHFLRRNAENDGKIQGQYAFIRGSGECRKSGGAFFEEE